MEGLAVPEIRIHHKRTVVRHRGHLEPGRDRIDFAYLLLRHLQPGGVGIVDDVVERLRVEFLPGSLSTAGNQSVLLRPGLDSRAAVQLFVGEHLQKVGTRTAQHHLMRIDLVNVLVSADLRVREGERS